MNTSNLYLKNTASGESEKEHERERERVEREKAILLLQGCSTCVKLMLLARGINESLDQVTIELHRGITLKTDYPGFHLC